jgi:hypothetical protein
MNYLKKQLTTEKQIRCAVKVCRVTLWFWTESWEKLRVQLPVRDVILYGSHWWENEN